MMHASDVKGSAAQTYLAKKDFPWGHFWDDAILQTSRFKKR